MCRTKPKNQANNRLVCNHAKYVTDTAVGYFMGNPITYVSGSDITPLLDLMREMDSDTQDIDLGLCGSIFGVSYEFIYISTDGRPRFCSPDPRQAFVIYDDTVEHKPLCGVYYYELYDSTRRTCKGYSVYCADDTICRTFTADTSFNAKADNQPQKPHGLGGVPIIEIYNNSGCTGDFEPVLSLIDAYNILQSDRVNDKQQFVDAILLLRGTVLGDTNKEKGETYQALKDYGLLEVGENASAEWLTRQFDEASVEILRKSIEQDIHKFSNVPCMSDESFAGNASGVAMRYKLLGFEQLTKIKQRYFKEGVQERIKLLCSYLNTVHSTAINPAEVVPQFSRALPVNEVEKGQLVSELRDVVPADILLAQLPFVDDPKAAAEQMEQQKAEMFSPNTLPDDII